MESTCEKSTYYGNYGMIRIQLKESNKRKFMIQVARLASMINILSNIDVFPKVDRMVMAKHELVVYTLDGENE